MCTRFRGLAFVLLAAAGMGTRVSAAHAPTATMHVSFTVLEACTVQVDPTTRPSVRCSGRATPILAQKNWSPAELNPPSWTVYF